MAVKLDVYPRYYNHLLLGTLLRIHLSGWLVMTG